MQNFYSARALDKIHEKIHFTAVLKYIDPLLENIILSILYGTLYDNIINT